MKTFITLLISSLVLAASFSSSGYSQDKNSVDTTHTILRMDKYKDLSEITAPVKTKVNQIPQGSLYSPLATKIASVSGNWNDTITWGGSTIPTSSDDVTINNDINVTINAAAVCNSLVIVDGDRSNLLEITGSNSLSVSGAIVINAGTGRNDNKIINIGSGTLSCSSITIANPGNDNRYCRLTITTGTLNVTGNIIMNGNGNMNQLMLTGSGTVNVGGNISGGNLETYSGSTINYNGNGAQTIYTTNYDGNLVCSGTGKKTFTGDMNTIYMVSGNLTVKAGSELITDDIYEMTLNVNGIFNEEAGAVVSLGGLAGGRLVVTGTGKSHNISGTINIYWALRFDYPSGTSTSTVTVNNGAIITNDAAAEGQLTLRNGVILTISSGAVLNNYNDITIQALCGINILETSRLTVNGIITNGANGSIYSSNINAVTINGTFNYHSGYWVSGSNPVIYGSAGTLVYTGTTLNTTNFEWPSANTPFNVKINSTGNITLHAARTVNGNLYLLQGQFVNGARLTLGNGTVINRSDGTLSAAPTFSTSVHLIYSGTNPITTGPENPVSSTVLYNLTINNTGGITLDKNTTINRILTLTNGILKTTSSYTLYFGVLATSPSEGCGGYIEGTAVMNQRTAGSSNLDFLNCFIHTGANIGNVTITRVTGSDGIISSNGNSGIAANWDIVTTIPLGTGVTKDVTYRWPCELDNEHVFAPTILAQLYYVNGTTLEPVGAGIDVSGSDPRNITVAHSHFSKYTIGSSDAPLPVRLSSFTSSPRGRNVLLDWVTTSEINNAGFNVERILRSELKIQNWEKIGFVNGKGTVNTPTNYSFEDKNLQTGKYMYRLKQIDNNGNFEYFALNGEVEVGVPKKFSLSQNYPNPFNPTTKIDFDLPVDSKVNIVLYDMNGREVRTLVNGARTAGYHTVQFNGSDLSSGIYFYRISADKFVMAKKMMLIK
ncbi:MAG: T9SS type A sorting domain-containing protein [Ignavibacteria bacterium]